MNKIFIPLLICILIFTTCKKGNYYPPVCIITSPLDGQEIVKGESIPIAIDVSSNTGTIEEVICSMDNSDKHIVLNPPYQYEWSTINMNFGNHIVKVVAIDNEGNRTIDKVTIYIITGGSVPDGYFTDNRDSQEYAYKIIGSQTWMAQNLNYETANSSVYNDSVKYGDLYGRLYKWEDALNACPNGWHLPSDDEWKELEIYLGMSQILVDINGWRSEDVGEKLKSKTGWSYDGNGLDKIGFNALPGGHQIPSGSFFSQGQSGFWWTSTTAYDSLNAWKRGLTYHENGVFREYRRKEFSFSVRCIKD